MKKLLAVLFLLASSAFAQCPNPSSPQVNDGMIEFDSGACSMSVGTVQQSTIPTIHVKHIDGEIQYGGCGGSILKSEITISVPASIGHPGGQVRRFTVQFNHQDVTYADTDKHIGWNVDMNLPFGTIITISTSSVVPSGCQYEFKWRLQDDI